MKAVSLLCLLQMILCQAALAQIPNDAVARFNFDDQTANDEISGLKGRMVGTMLTDDRFGNGRHALYFLGNEHSYVSLGTSKVLKPNSGTISLWAKIELVNYSGRGATINPILLTKNGNGDDFFEAYEITYSFGNNRIEALCSLDSLRQIAVYGLERFDISQWHHLCVSYDDKILAFYIDGKEAGRQIKNYRTVFDPMDSVMIGFTANKKNSRYLTGIVDDVVFFNRVLAPNEIQSLYNAPNPNRARMILRWSVGVLCGLMLVLIIYSFLKLQLNKTLEREREQQQLQNVMYETELRVNRALMNPHFVFNSLNALQNLILKSEVDKANNYLVNFSKLIRRIMDSNNSNEITLRSEIELLEQYMEIEDIRFEERITHKITVSNKMDPSDIKIPVMMLQPLVENAIWHGLLKKPDDRRLSIDFSLIDDTYVKCVVDDNGVGRKSNITDKTKKQSLAISFIEQRLTLLNKIFELNCELSIFDKPEGRGTTVTILLPILNW